MTDYGMTQICNKCGDKFFLGMGNDYYKDENGELQPYGHIQSREQYGVVLSTGCYYCPKCKVAHEINIAEFETPKKPSDYDDPLGWIMDLNLEDHPCPTCGTQMVGSLRGLPCNKDGCDGIFEEGILTS